MTNLSDPDGDLILERPVVHRLGNVYTAEWQNAGIMATCRNLRQHSDALTGEVTWQYWSAERWVTMTRSSLNFTQLTNPNLVKTLVLRFPGTFNFAGAIDQLRILVPDAWREGEPFILLGGHEVPDAPPFLVERLLPENNSTVIYGDGQAGKSIAAMGIGLSVATGKPYGGVYKVKRPGPVLYLDWETSADDQAFRFRRLRQSYVGKEEEAPQVYYRRMTGALADQVDTLTEFCEKHGIVLVIVDSLGWATGDELKEAGPAIRVMDAARAIGRTTLFVAHVTKDEARKEGRGGRGGGGKATIFGSKFFELAARYTWEVIGTQNELDGSKTLKMHNRKANNVQRSEPVGLRVEFDGTAGAIRILDINLAADPAGPATLGHRIANLLKTGAKTIAELADATGASADSVGTTLRRMADKGDVRQIKGTGPGKPNRWGLAAPDFAGRQASAFDAPPEDEPEPEQAPPGPEAKAPAPSAAAAAVSEPVAPENQCERDGCSEAIYQATPNGELLCERHIGEWAAENGEE